MLPLSLLIQVVVPLLLVGTEVAAVETTATYATVSGSPGSETCTVSSSVPTGGFHAVAHLAMTANATGWNSLWVETANHTSLPASSLAFAAGCAEGFANAAQIADAKYDLYAGWGLLDGKPVPKRLRAFLEENLEFTMGLAQAGVRSQGSQGSQGSQVSKGSKDDGRVGITFGASSSETLPDSLLDPPAEYTDALAGVVAQVRGLVAGYALQTTVSAADPIDLFAMWMMNAAGSMEDLVGLLSDPRDGMVGKPDAPLETDCSALIRIAGGDVYFAHTTWRSFTMMTRVLKRYQLEGAHAVSLSSTPAFVSSKDDFYLTSAGLMVMETTNNVFNESLWRVLTPRSLLTFVRSTVANRIASSPKEWVDTFAMYNSGTYSNQWMVLDARAAAEAVGMGNAVPPGAFWIAEQVPGLVATRDVTDVLNRQGFWSSYNIPYLPEIYNISGYPAKAANNPSYSYKDCPRAKIFARDAPTVADLDGMRSIMQSCRWKTDPLSLGKPFNCISSRYDLIDPATGVKPAAFGGIDAKVASARSVGLSKSLGFTAITGPTHAQSDTPPFSWSDPEWVGKAHRGQPDTFDFPWCQFDNAPPQN